MRSRLPLRCLLACCLLLPGPALAAPTTAEVAAAYARSIGAGRYGRIDSFLVQRGDRLVLERYWRGYDAGRLHECYSVTKSVTCLLALAAMKEGRLPGPGTPLAQLLPQYREILSGPKAALTLAHVLGMSAGLDWDELSTGYNDPRNPVNELLRSPDPVRLLLQRRLVQEPGRTFTYNSALSNLLGRVVEGAVGEPIDRYAARVLFRPLGIRQWRWDRLGPDLNCGWGLWLRPRDMLAIGRLLLGHGRWRGEPVLDEALLAEALRPRLPASPRADYAWQFWAKRYPGRTAGGGSYPLALGWGGQFIVLLPELDTVIVSTADDYDADQEGILAFLDELVGRLADAGA